MRRRSCDYTALAESETPNSYNRWTITNVYSEALTIGALGAAMPSADFQSDIEQSVWNDPHLGLDHGFVEYVRVVLDEQTLIGTHYPIHLTS